MRKLLLIFNHTLTKEQTKDAKDSLGVCDFVSLPSDLQNVWGSIPPNMETISDTIKPIKEFVINNGDKSDFALIQGDFGACYELVNFCKEIGLMAVYSTNRRVSTETVIDGIVHKSSQFQHCIYRKY